MPVYVYECPRCQSRIELLQKFDGRAPTCELCETHNDCPNGCYDGPEMEKVITKTSFILNGSGWAKDGYGGSK